MWYLVANQKNLDFPLYYNIIFKYNSNRSKFQLYKIPSNFHLQFIFKKKNNLLFITPMNSSKFRANESVSQPLLPHKWFFPIRYKFGIKTLLSSLIKRINDLIFRPY